MRGPLVPVLVSLFTACSSVPGGDRDPALMSAIDSVVHLWLAVDSTPGISIAVVHQGDTLAIRGYGLADVEQQVALSEDGVRHRLGDEAVHGGCGDATHRRGPSSD